MCQIFRWPPRVSLLARFPFSFFTFPLFPSRDYSPLKINTHNTIREIRDLAALCCVRYSIISVDFFLKWCFCVRCSVIHVVVMWRGSRNPVSSKVIVGEVCRGLLGPGAGSLLPFAPTNVQRKCPAPFRPFPLKETSATIFRLEWYFVSFFLTTYCNIYAHTTHPLHVTCRQSGSIRSYKHAT